MEHGIVGTLIVVAALVLIFGGSRKIEDMGRGLGGFMREFNKARREAEEPPVPAAAAKAKPKRRPVAKKKKKA